MQRRSGTIVLILALGLLCPAPAAAAPKKAPPAVTPETVDDAITKGVDYLLGKQRPDGSFGTGSHAIGQTALATFALLHAGLREEQNGRDAAQLRKSLRYLDRNGPGRAGKRDVDPGTYTTSLLVLLLRERARPIDAARIQRLVDLLVRTQAKNGQWWYFGAPGKTGKGGPDTGDNSNTQFAVLALAAAHGEGHTVPRETLDKAARWWSTTQKDDGGWGYASGGSPKSATTGSMTAAAVACLGALRACGCRTDGAPEADPLARGLRWMAEHFSVDKNHGPTKGGARQRQKNAGRGWLHYYLWTLERAFVLADVEKIAGHDWYREGAARLLRTQKKDGSWRGEHPLYATSFGLLFLTRAADPPRAFTAPKAGGAKPSKPGPVITGPQDPASPTPSKGDAEEKPASPAPIEGTLEVWIDEELAPGELARRCRTQGVPVLVELVGFLQDPVKGVRSRAWEALTELLPPEPLFRADRHPLARGRLRSWLRRNGPVLQLVDGRYVIPKAPSDG